MGEGAEAFRFVTCTDMLVVVFLPDDAEAVAVNIQPMP